MEKGLLFTYTLTYGGALVSLFNPYVGFLIYVCFAIIRPADLWFWAVPPGNYSRIVAIALLIGWVLRGFGNWHLGKARSIVLLLLGYWVWSVISALYVATDQDVAWHFVEGLTKIVLPFLVGVTCIDSVRKLKVLAWVIVLSQGYCAYECNISYLNGFNQLQLIGFGGVDNNCFAIECVTVIGLAFFLGLYAPGWWRKLLAFAIAAILAHAVLISFSRGALLALLVTGCFAFFLIPKSLKHYLIFAVAVLLMIRLTGKEVYERFESAFSQNLDESAQSRLELWKACASIMVQKPLGLGPDHFPVVAQDYGFNEGKEAHSLWLQLGAELGIPGLALLLAFFLLILARLWPFTRARFVATDPWFQDSARMVIASLVGFMMAAQFVSFKGFELPYYIAILGVGVLKLTSPGVEREALLLSPPLGREGTVVTEVVS
jgi:probable O-glycosylation ligase (exosortase A-associated)